MEERRATDSQDINGSEDVNIELGAETSRVLVQRTSPLTNPDVAVVPYGQPLGSGVLVFMRQEVMQRLDIHAAEDTSRESGGILLGDAYLSGCSKVVEIEDFIHAEKAEGSRAELRFTHESWERINAEKERKPEHLRIVGWYHTHPDMGVFLSGQDMFIQKNFFREPCQVALVLDPVRKERGIFCWAGADVVRTSGFYIYARRSQKKELARYVKKLIHEETMVSRTAANRRTRVESGRPTQQSPPSRFWNGILVGLLVLMFVKGFYVKQLRQQVNALFADVHGPARYLQTAEEMIAIGEYEQAAINLRIAWAKDSSDPKIVEKLVNTLSWIPSPQDRFDAASRAVRTAAYIAQAGNPRDASQLLGYLQRMSIQASEDDVKQCETQIQKAQTSSTTAEQASEGIMGRCLDGLKKRIRHFLLGSN
ncbi:MAG: Mov34/MPN/PAD-1 family protein [Armatimonadetes bacterium]|nr:Mov34/MPN/PAD-1 family protein [Armatimonadota bacterium]